MVVIWDKEHKGFAALQPGVITGVNTESLSHGETMKTCSSQGKVQPLR